MSKSRCLLILESLPTIAGGQRALLNILPALAGYDLHVLLPGPGPLAEALRAGGATCHFAAMASYTLVRKNRADIVRFPFDQLGLACRCVLLALRLDADLLYANSGRAFAWGTIAAWLTRRPILWHVHNLLADPKTLALFRRLGRWGTIRRIIVASSGAAAQLPDLEYKTVVIPYGVDTAAFHPDLAARARVRSELGIPLDAAVVGIVGDLIPLKGQHTLLEAARLKADETYYVVVGAARPGDDESGTYATRLREMAGGNMILTGHRGDAPAVLNALDLLVIASERETGPLVLLEALACGIPVISTPVGRAPELLPPEALFPVGDTAGLVGRLRFWLADRQRLQAASRAARHLAEEQLSMERFRISIRSEIEHSLPNYHA
jgi:glycosyltransferase involved in cell wall biosynthesis